MQSRTAFFLILSFVLLCFSSCRLFEASKGSEELSSSGPWKLIWNEEFEDEIIDTSKWSRIPPNSADWGNFMTSDERCYDLKDGFLYLNGIENTDQGVDQRPFLTGGIWTKNKFSFQYGKVEIRAKLESAQGAWPAMWMLAQNNIYGKYPRNGEIDIMEHLNFDEIIYQTTHSYYTLELNEKNNPPHHGTVKVDVGEFNIYGLEWFPDRLDFTLNGVKTFTYPKVDNVDSTQWPYDQAFFLLIDQQLGGSWVGEIAPEQLPVSMIIDYVRIYQEE